MIRWVAFDLDGVVIPTEQSFHEFSARFGVTLDQIRGFFGAHGEATLLGEADLFALLPAAMREWGVRAELEHFSNSWFTSISRVDPAVSVIVDQVQKAGLRCCAATNQDNRRAEFLEAHTEIPELFPVRVYSCHIGAAKPQQAYFEKAEGMIRAEPGEILFLDDKQENLDAARARGWHAERATCAPEILVALRRHTPGFGA